MIGSDLPKSRRHGVIRPRHVASLAMLALACGCRSDASPKSALGDRTIVANAPPTPPAAGAPPALGPDSLPLLPYADAPGWYVPFGRLASADTASTSLTPPLVEGANVRLFVFPPNDVWRRVRRRRIALLFAGGAAEARVVAADSMQAPRPTAGRLSPVDVAVASLPAGTEWLSGMWVLPRPTAGAARLSPRRTVFGDTAIVWAVDGVALVLRRTGVTTARLFARTAAGALVPLREIAIDAAADSSMGVTSDSVLRLSGKGDWRIPTVGGVFRLGPSGPWVFVLVESGYECSNDRLVRVDSTSARFLDSDDDHYAECTT